MSTPAIIYLAFVFLSLGVSMANHGKPKKGTESFWTSLIAVGISCGLLYWGGFFGKA